MSKMDTAMLAIAFVMAAYLAIFGSIEAVRAIGVITMGGVYVVVYALWGVTRK